MNPIRAFAFVLLLALPVAGAEPEVWPQWRGPTRDGLVAGAPWPNKLEGDALKRVWRVENLGPSYSGPIVTADRVFTTQTVDKKAEVVTAHDRKTGKELWKASWEGAITVPFFAAKNGSWIRSTPAFDGKTLFVAGIKDLLVALDGATGKERWRCDFVKEFGAPPPDFGFVCSPLVDDTGVYVQAGGCFAKLDKATGKVLWKALKDGGGTMGSAFSSPVFARLAGKEQVLVQTRTKLAGVDRGTGEELWVKEIPSFRGMNILTPVPVGDDGVFTSTYGGNTRLLRLKSDGGRYSAEDAWSFKYEGNMTSPVVVAGHAYLLGKDKRLLCTNLETGKEVWRSEERFGDYWSLVANGDKVLALDQRGTLYLFRASTKEFDLLDQRKVADAETWAHLAVCGNEVVIRDLTGLTMWRWGAR
ncbi:PQQ-binding-like beta-propeller repeat protein [Gemmata sp. JC673]|uniref:PQQ-binding-like beta-propeller repeat protein n=1 Tax=Gemmata algarum TaxID=2975278 RepID=A0ABU5F5E4_9BACT|nr:PQQ-binding-like beta-propeller repeat protein [Gemmata algarum]MDY3562399.1 PQQ-binding-like beta-propeller repeat protein [Gemmata algarum]